MSISVMLHDTRLEGRYIFAGYQRVVRVNRFTSMNYAMNRVRAIHRRHGRLDVLGIACHGYEDTVLDRQGRQSIHIGGFGLEFCREDLDLMSVSTTRRIRGMMDRIIVYSCSAASTHPDAHHYSYIGDHAEGQRLMSQLAYHTGARVYAADTTQYSNTMRDGQQSLGRWYGNVYEFDPDTGQGNIIQSYPDDYDPDIDD